VIPANGGVPPWRGPRSLGLSAGRGDPSPLPQLQRSERVVQWMPEQNALLFFNQNETPARIQRLDLAAERARSGTS